MADINLGAINNTTQIPQLMQQNQAAGNALIQQNINNQINKNRLASVILGTAAKSGNPELFQSARQHLEKNGVDTSAYSPDLGTAMKQAQFGMLAGASPTETMQAMIMNEEMRQRAGAATGNMERYGYNGSNPIGDMFEPVQSGQNQAQTQPMAQGKQMQPETQQPARNANFSPPQLPQNQQQAAPSMNGMTVPQALQSGEPVQGVNEPTKAYAQRVKVWQEQNDINPNLQGAIAAGKGAGEETAGQVKQLNEDAINSSNMINSISEIQQAANQAKMGAFGPAKASLLKAADWLGLPASMVPQVTAYGDIAKISNDLIGNAAKGAGQASRLQGEFKAIQGSVPGLSIDPNAMNSLLPMLSRKHYQIIQEQNAWDQYAQKNPNPIFNNFATPWVAQQTQNQQQQGGNLPAYPLPNNLPAKGSAAYEQQESAPQQPIQYKTGLIRNGYVFKGGDPTKQSSWQKVQ
jgi:hypothetical protein